LKPGIVTGAREETTAVHSQNLSHDNTSRRPQQLDSLAIVWFKRDLRVGDHAPLVAAAAYDRAIGLFIIEPEWLGSPECDERHVAYTLACLRMLRADLAALGLMLCVRVGSACEVLASLSAEVGKTVLFSHEETGTGWSYQRDLAVAQWCRVNAVPWQEWTQTGVVRRLKSRRGWAAQWAQRMNQPQAATAHLRFKAVSGLAEGLIPTCSELGLPADSPWVEAFAGEAHSSMAGERAAWARMEQFLGGGAQGYRRALSSPLTAEDGCSRLSVYLAFGNVSMRSVHQATEAQIAQCLRTGDKELARGLRGFAGRLRWHCHFMQKLEDQPAVEFQNFSRAYDGLRPGDGHPLDAAAEQRLRAWSEGHTGYPMVDACMRSLCATGWLNFRMRAMLVSFASYHLWLHWRQTGLHLARQFLDFEPGIHWSQMQMQSGTTAINTLRIYSPTKQAQDQDPQGTFIRRWVPELRGVPLAFLAQPWQMSEEEQVAAGCVIGRDYPAPIVMEKTVLAHAKSVLYGLRKAPQARAEASAIAQKHGSRKSGLPQTGRTSQSRVTKGRKAAKPDLAAVVQPGQQLELFDGA